MSIKAAFYAQAADSGGIGGVIEDRIYPATDAPQKPTLPYATYQMISSVPVYHQAAGDLYQTRFQVNCYGETSVDAESVRDAFCAEFDEYRGELGELVTVLGCFIEDITDLAITPSDASQRGPQAEVLELIFWHENE